MFGVLENPCLQPPREAPPWSALEHASPSPLRPIPGRGGGGGGVQHLISGGRHQLWSGRRHPLMMCCTPLYCCLPCTAASVLACLPPPHPPHTLQAPAPAHQNPKPSAPPTLQPSLALGFNLGFRVFKGFGVWSVWLFCCYFVDSCCSAGIWPQYAKTAPLSRWCQPEEWLEE